MNIIAEAESLFDGVREFQTQEDVDIRLVAEGDGFWGVYFEKGDGHYFERVGYLRLPAGKNLGMALQKWVVEHV